MKRFRILIRPESSLYFGGYAENTGSSDGDTAEDSEGLLIPGSAVRGALREAALRLVRGAGLREELVGRIFGHRPEDRLAPESWEGPLRVGPLRAEAAAEASLRHHVSLERASRQAVQGRLFQKRVTPAGHGLCFEGELGLTDDLGDEELDLLRAAIQITDQIGGGRGRGIGLVRVEVPGLAGKAEPVEDSWEEDPSAAGLLAGLDPPEGREQELTLVLEALEPLRLGSVKDGTNLQGSKRYLDGSALRGATAAVICQHEKDQAEPVLGGSSPVSFGDAHPGDLGAIPAPFTLLVPKRGKGELIDTAVALAAGTYVGRDFGKKEAKGSIVRVDGSWLPARPKLRTITRSAREHADGRAAHQMLFSLEIMDPLQQLNRRLPEEKLRFYAPVRGTGEQLRVVTRAAARGLTVGGTRGRGLGRLRLAEVLAGNPWPDLKERHARWTKAVAEAAGRAEVSGLVAESTGVLLALGPVALKGAEVIQTLRDLGLRVLDGRTRRDSLGGWNRKAGLPRALQGVFLPGSVWIVQTEEKGNALESLAELEGHGLGPGRTDGWGRLVACHPIHLDCLDSAENKKNDPEPKEEI